MRIDEIDLIGNFTINGLSPQTDQFLGLSGSELAWLDAAPSQSGFSIYGNRYVYCNSDEGNQVSSGTNLKNAYASASAFIVSATARGAVLVSPGVYDFNNSPLNLTASYIDIIGISSDANSVLLKATNADYVIQLINSNVDTALCNVTLGTASLYAVDNPGTHTGTYLRWDNVIVRGNDFVDSTLSLGSEGLNGEFKNIKVYDSDYSFYVISGSLDGKYDNIELNNVTQRAFGSDGGSLFGTYSNITINGTVSLAFYGEINATFENIKCGNITDSILIGNSINGNFKDIEIGDVSNSVFYSESTSITGTFENITIGEVSQNAFYSSDEINGTFKNIKTGNVSQNVFSANATDLLGTFSNIEVGNVNTFGISVGSINGNFSNIKIGNSSGVFRTFANIYGNFDNIEFGTCGDEYSFSAVNGTIVGTFSNIKSDGLVRLYHAFGDISGKFSNIEVGYNPDYPTFFTTDGGRTLGEFNDITFDENGGIFFLDGGIFCEIKNITSATANGYCFYTQTNAIQGTFSNIKVGNVTGVTLDVFSSATYLLGTIENVEIGDISGKLFYSGLTQSVKVENLKTGNIGTSAFTTDADDFFGVLKNVTLGNVGGDVFVGNSNLDGIFDRINVSNVSGNIYRSTNNSSYGTYSNINIGLISGMLFNSGASINGTYRNIIFASASAIFDGGTNNVLVDNMVGNSYVPQLGGGFSGKIINSSINALGFTKPSIYLLDGALVERCTFLSDSGEVSIKGSTINAQISLTRANEGISPDITNLIDTPLNILQ
jgi:hypothetical protein